MLPCFKKHVMAVCAIAILLPVIASTLWPLLTGQMMAASLGGLLLQFALFFGGLAVGYRIFERRSERMADGFVRLYDQDCDPEAFLAKGSAVAQAITFPCNDQCAWYMGCYAQACLDAGRRSEAERIYAGLQESVRALKQPIRRCGVIVALIPLVEKMGTLSEAQDMVEEGLRLISQDGSADASVMRQYLQSQAKVVQARRSGDLAALVKLDEGVVGSPSYPMRSRVEFAWDAASACFRLDRPEDERRYLRFIVDHGGSLALVPLAEKRLAALDVPSSGL